VVRIGISAVHARAMVETLARVAESGPIFDAIYRCARELDSIVRSEATESFRAKSIDDLQISVRLRCALAMRNIETLRQLEATTADELKSKGPPGSSGYFGKKCLCEVRETLASFGLKLRGDP
jgi:DNA-directed RNA polymerase alpha subunit